MKNCLGRMNLPHESINHNEDKCPLCIMMQKDETNKADLNRYRESSIRARMSLKKLLDAVGDVEVGNQ